MKPTAEWEKEAWDEDLDKNSHKTLSEDSRNATGARGRETRHHVRREECCRRTCLQSPKNRNWQQVKRIVKYLACTRDYVQKIEVNSDVIANKSIKHPLDGWSDTDFVGDVESMRSTSCAVLRLDGAVIPVNRS